MERSIPTLLRLTTSSVLLPRDQWDKRMASTGGTKAMNNTQGCLLKHVATPFWRRVLVMGQHAATRNQQKHNRVLLCRVAVQHGQAASLGKKPGQRPNTTAGSSGVRVMAFSATVWGAHHHEVQLQ
jgi:hypothetical protein